MMKHTICRDKSFTGVARLCQLKPKQMILMLLMLIAASILPRQIMAYEVPHGYDIEMNFDSEAFAELIRQTADNMIRRDICDIDIPSIPGMEDYVISHIQLPENEIYFHKNDNSADSTTMLINMDNEIEGVPPYLVMNMHMTLTTASCFHNNDCPDASYRELPFGTAYWAGVHDPTPAHFVTISVGYHVKADEDVCCGCKCRRVDPPKTINTERRGSGLSCSDSELIEKCDQYDKEATDSDDAEDWELQKNLGRQKCSGRKLCIEYDDFTLPPELSRFKEDIAPILEPYFKYLETCQEVGGADISLPDDLEQTGFGVSLDKDRGRLAIRFEHNVTGEPDMDRWEKFIQNGSDKTASNDLSILMDEGLLEHPFLQAIRDVADEESALKLQSMTHTWSWAENSKKRLEIEARINAYVGSLEAAHANISFVLDFGPMTPWVTSTKALNITGEVNVSVHREWWARTWVLALISGLSGGLLGPVSFGANVVSVVALIGAIKASKYDDDASLDTDQMDNAYCETEEASSNTTTIECSIPVDPILFDLESRKVSPVGKIIADTVEQNQGDLEIAGDMEISDMSYYHDRLFVNRGNYDWEQDFDLACYDYCDYSTCSYSYEKSEPYEITVDGYGRFCGLRELDRYGMYSVRQRGFGRELPESFSTTYDDSLFSKPYPLSLYVRSSSTHGIFELNFPKPPSEEDLENRAKYLALCECTPELCDLEDYIPEAIDPWWWFDGPGPREIIDIINNPEIIRTYVDAVIPPISTNPIIDYVRVRFEDLAMGTIVNIAQQHPLWDASDAVRVLLADSGYLEALATENGRPRDFVLTALAPQTDTVWLPTPASYDKDGLPRAITGTLIESNGQILPSPLPIEQERIALGLGRHVIEWVSSDSVILDWQEIEIVPAIRTSGTVSIGDRARIVSNAGIPTIVNAGESMTHVGADAKVGGLITNGPVDIDDRAEIAGSIESTATVVLGNDVYVQGDIIEFSDVVIPDVSAVGEFITNDAEAVTVDPYREVQLAPGTYGDVRVGAYATLKLGGGNYYFNSLNLVSTASITLPEYSRGVNLYISETAVLRGEIASAPGLGLSMEYFGYDTLQLETEFFGKLVAPNATVVMTQNYFGEISAANLEIWPDVVLTAEMIPRPYTSQSVCGNGRIEDGEACDDGNRNNDDGCSAVCQLEYDFDQVCDDGLNDESTNPTCEEECVFDAECFPYLCHNGVCQKPAGSECVNNAECQSNICEDAVCQENPEKETCDSHLYLDGYCIKAIGEECSVNAECESFLCEGAVCVENASTCSELFAFDIGAPGNNVTVPTNGCIMVRDQFPSWWEDRIMKLETTEGGTYPIPFSWTNDCSGRSGEATFTNSWQSLYVGPISKDCAMLIDLHGLQEGTVSLRYWAN